jgi:hypothetical protein
MAQRSGKLVIDAGSIIRDIRSGMTDWELMRKYGLTAKGLQSAFNKLVARKHITHFELCSRSNLYEDSAVIQAMAELPRIYLPFRLSIQADKAPRTAGIVRDITEQDVGVLNIPADEDETELFHIPPHEPILTAPISFEGLCAWSRRDEATGVWISRFEITNISDEGIHEIRKVMSFAYELNHACVDGPCLR